MPSKPLPTRNGIRVRARAQESNLIVIPSHKRPVAEKTAERSCIVSGEALPKSALLRFVVSPDGVLVADLEWSLPGRGIWVRPSLLREAIGRRLFSRAHGGAVGVPEGFLDSVERLLRARAMNCLGLARRAGQAVAGFDQVRDVLSKGRGGSVVAARDGAIGGRNKIRRAAARVPVVEVFDGTELSSAMGKENVVHVVVAPGKFAQQIIRYADILSCLRPQDVPNVDADLSAAV